MASVSFLSSLFKQVFSNETLNTKASSFSSHVAKHPWTKIRPFSSWTWTSDTKLFALLTTKSSTHLFPPPKSVPDGYYLGLSIFYVISLYGLLISPYPRTTRTKQIIAFPILFAMVLQPLFFNCPTPFFHMVMSVIGFAVGTRMVDLYFVQPWTGIPSRYSLEGTPMDADARSKKDLDSDDNENQDRITVKQPGHHHQPSIRKEEFLMWDKKRFRLEMWAPLRRFSVRKDPTVPSQIMDKKQLFLLSFGYNALFVFVLFAIYPYSYEDLQRMDLIQHAFAMVGFGIFIFVQIVGLCVTTALIYSMVTGCPVDTSEWQMLRNKLPCFALTPAEFWLNWQTIFRYLWVDLGFLPVRRLCDQHLGPHRVGGVRFAKMIRETLPVLMVFTLSGIMHAYIVYAVWRESVWSQLFYFITQGVAVVLTKAVERSWFGIMIHRTFIKGSRPVRWVLQCLGLLMMGIFHMITLPIFMEPYKKSEMWKELGRSILWWIFGN
ncbi:hypothetical protein BGZ65_003321 [Modicella reniformis]|uniref:Wax synthase domain-containing protein n=1 Tax=Modicella reniformis TaxID=1440133 RepID=A0A9P6INU8_9FUNG|nr:hypothetical protein BGZ65_003321 [Modicella reniformis]